MIIAASSEAIGPAANVALTLIVAAMGVAFLRLVRGPSLADRVVALDVIVVFTVTFLALVTIETGQTVYLDVAITLALVGFLGTIAFARFAEHRVRQDATNQTASFERRRP